MLPRPCLPVLCLAALPLLLSCAPAASPSGPAVAPSVQAPATATPFQPGSGTLALLTPPAPLQHPTFTPYPVIQVRGAALPAPQVTMPSAAEGLVQAAVNPLTGLAPADAALLERRPLAVKISNYGREIRPQYGLNEADVVFEYYIEWLNTRFIGVFYGNDAKQIGPVRSGRYFDEHITRMYHSYYVFNYADPREFQYFLGGDLEKWVVVPGYGECPPFFQFKASSLVKDMRHYETYFDSTRFAACLGSAASENTRQPLRGAFFSGAVPDGGYEVSRIYTHYSKCDYNYWEYDTQSGRYLRFQEVSPIQTPAHLNDCSDTPETYAPLTDALNSRQVAADNVIEIFVSHSFANQNEQDDEIYHISLVDSGAAFVFRDGLGYPARWMRTDIDQPLLLTTPSGAPFYLKPGTSFYQVIGETSSDWSEGSHWHFDFHTP